MKRLALLTLLLFCSSLNLSRTAPAQDLNPAGLDLPVIFGAQQDQTETEVVISATLTKLSENSVSLAVTMQLPAGCHTYSMDPSFGAATSIKLTSTAGLTESGTWQADRAPKSGFDEVLQQNTEKFYDRVTWTRTLTGTVSDATEIVGKLNGQFCNSSGCFPLFDKAFTAKLSNDSTPPDQTPATSTADTVDSAATPAPADPSRQTLTPKIGFGKAARAGDVTFEISLSPANAQPGSEVTLTVKTLVAAEWHIFALDQNPDMAGIPTTIELTDLQGLELTGSDFTPDREPQTESPLPDISQRVHYGEITWSRKLKVTDAAAAAGGSIRFQICRHGVCKPPTTAKFQVTLAGAPAPTTPADTQTSTDSLTDSPPANRTAAPPSAGIAGNSLASGGLLKFLLTAIVAGFVALATPCVFPMIPITVAFFLKQEEKRAGSSMKLALVYCLSIIAAFTVLGIAMAKIFGESSLTNLANNPWLNLFFSALFIAFALMLLGAFELTVPNWLLNWTSSRESAGGMLGVVFMALTFTLVSFTCTFAFVGSLLVLSAQGDFFWPVLGMLGFSTAFASPFFILAMFPSMLRKLPRSGGWMNDVKFVIGLIELAAVVKFLSVADIGLSASGIPVFVTYSVFLWLWIAIAAYAGLYLLGLKIGPRPKLSAPRCIFAAAFLLFAGRLAAGALGSPLPDDFVWRQVAAFAPPQIKEGDIQQHAALGYAILQHDQAWSLEHPRAMTEASQKQQLLFLDITGINCVNCRLMEETVLTRKDVQDRLAGMVLSKLYLDSVPGISDTKLQEELLTHNRNLAAELLQDVTMPSYAVVAPDGKRVLAIFKGLDQSGGANFLEFLDSGISRWKQICAKEVPNSKLFAVHEQR